MNDHRTQGSLAITERLTEEENILHSGIPVLHKLVDDAPAN